MTVWQATIAMLATWQTIEIWHHGHIFDELQQRLKASSRWYAYLVTCPFCLSPYVAALWLIVTLAESTWHTDVFYQVLYVFMLALAVSRLANLANDVFHCCTRTPHPPPFELPDSPVTNPEQG